MDNKTGNTNGLKPFYFPEEERSARARITALKASGAIRKIAPRLYTSLADDKVPRALRVNWREIVSRLFPGAIVSHHTAFTNSPNSDGEVFLTTSYNRTHTFPGLTVHLMKGPEPDVDDTDFLSLKHSSPARMFLENLQMSKGKISGRSVSREKLEERLESLLQQENGEEKIKCLRDQARSLSERLEFEREFKKLDQIIGALLGSRPHSDLRSDSAKSQAVGKPYDTSCLERLNLLAEDLSAKVLPEFKNVKGPEHFRNKAFFESYFSNYIEGTEFLIEEAEGIIFDKEIPEERPQDAHDILDSFLIVSDPTEMMVVPKTIDDLEKILKSRHARMFKERPQVQPGVYKKKKNRAGETVFVSPDLILGTLEAGFKIYCTLPPGLARAIYMMFLISEVHPFNDGNGRISRIMMNAELLNQELSTIIIPTVYREDYLAALRALSRQKRPDPFSRMLIRAADFSNLDFTDYAAVKETMIANFWFADSDLAKIRVPPKR